MKKGVVLLVLLVLAGCATNNGTSRVMDLRSKAHFRDQRVLHMTFPEIQMALFKHQAACGSAPVFAMEPGKTAFARLTDRPLEGSDYKQIIYTELVHYRGSDLGTVIDRAADRDWRTRATTYSFYADSAVDERIEKMFNAITHPQDCTGQGAAAQDDEGKAEK
ncbi:hypothetical protein LKR43_08505 [Pusillimonas sp. MFBS29]|uniref:hypothetical protein n=1 Tax=Pusillimonas sp. MFBS29 TaxID=2886690 RepID=UPI001D110995|nr:hypothetical protein [Pusillimonas sp. MFBS29]MCC2596381.1 hypothetical protein [Pusillimonas sp. MFBS29]